MVNCTGRKEEIEGMCTLLSLKARSRAAEPQVQRNVITDVAVSLPDVALHKFPPRLSDF